jgi:hypothetical protein
VQYNPTTITREGLKERKEELDERKVHLEQWAEALERRERLCRCQWESLGIVEDIEIYW